MSQRALWVLFGGSILACLLAGGLSASAAERSARQFLFVVDTSFSMAPQKETLRNAAYELVYSGLEGEMRGGDQFSFWTFNENPNPEQFQLTEWIPGERQILAGQAYRFLQNQPFQKISRFEKALTEILRSSQELASLTILILGDGLEFVRGTPFDRELNAAYAERSAELRRMAKPFVTVIQVHNGRITGWSIAALGERIRVPQIALPGRSTFAGEAKSFAAVKPPPPNEKGVAEAPALPQVPDAPKSSETLSVLRSQTPKWQAPDSDQRVTVAPTGNVTNVPTIVTTSGPVSVQTPAGSQPEPKAPGKLPVDAGSSQPQPSSPPGNSALIEKTAEKSISIQQTNAILPRLESSSKRSLPNPTEGAKPEAADPDAKSPSETVVERANVLAVPGQSLQSNSFPNQVSPPKALAGPAIGESSLPSSSPVQTTSQSPPTTVNPVPSSVLAPKESALADEHLRSGPGRIVNASPKAMAPSPSPASNASPKASAELPAHSAIASDPAPAPLNLALRLEGNPHVAQAAIITPMQSTQSRLVYTITGVAALTGGLVLILFIVRRPRSTPPRSSLISRSINKR